mmetsp:Transcript_99916/g.278226  ORF Transcript_99916/g.278226 Transcript_99916/m.278226 type:complete len:113 (+) Transcript_99916:90-428(+)
MHISSYNFVRPMAEMRENDKHFQELPLALQARQFAAYSFALGVAEGRRERKPIHAHPAKCPIHTDGLQICSRSLHKRFDDSFPTSVLAWKHSGTFVCTVTVHGDCCHKLAKP